MMLHGDLLTMGFCGIINLKLPQKVGVENLVVSHNPTPLSSLLGGVRYLTNSV